MVEDIFLIFKGSWPAYCHLSKGFPDDKMARFRCFQSLCILLVTHNFSILYLD